MKEWIKIFAPATIAGVGPGFDILGFAVSEPGDIVEARKTAEPGVKIVEITGDNGKLPLDAEKNTAGVGALEVLKTLGVKEGVEIKLHKNMPLGSGLGSSAASSVAAAYAVNALFGNKIDKIDLIPACMKGEELACGAGHADNVAPSMLGSFVIIRSYNPLDIISLPAPENLVCVIVNPEYIVKTEDARVAVPKQVNLKDAVSNWGNVAALIAALYKKDIKLLGKAINDKIVEPARAPLIPGFKEVKKAALDAGAYGCSISGSGPSIFAITDSMEKGNDIGEAMQKAFENRGLKSTVYVSKVNTEGARFL